MEQARESVGLRARNKQRDIIIAAVVVLAIAVAVFFLIRHLLVPSTMEGRLESYATEIYNKELKDMDSSSYTLNLNYLERKGYDVSMFNDKKCDKAGTYVIVSVDKDRNISGVTTQLKCGDGE